MTEPKGKRVTYLKVTWDEPVWHTPKFGYYKGEYYGSMTTLCGSTFNTFYGVVVSTAVAKSPRGKQCKTCREMRPAFLERLAKKAAEE